jgi:hypothetical protein
VPTTAAAGSGRFRYGAAMVNFVLVAGARLGSWAWDDVVPALRAGGHGAYPLTLSGLAEKQIARIVRGSTPHPGATLTEPATLAGVLLDAAGEAAVIRPGGARGR